MTTVERIDPADPLAYGEFYDAYVRSFNREFDQPYTRTHRLWREAPNFQRVILRNRGHLSSYMAGLTPELYRDSLTNFIVSNNPKK